MCLIVDTNVASEFFVVQALPWPHSRMLSSMQLVVSITEELNYGRNISARQRSNVC